MLAGLPGVLVLIACCLVRLVPLPIHAKHAGAVLPCQEKPKLPSSLPVIVALGILHPERVLLKPIHVTSINLPHHVLGLPEAWFAADSPAHKLHVSERQAKAGLRFMQSEQHGCSCAGPLSAFIHVMLPLP